MIRHAWRCEYKHYVVSRLMGGVKAREFREEVETEDGMSGDGVDMEVKTSFDPHELSAMKQKADSRQRGRRG